MLGIGGGTGSGTSVYFGSSMRTSSMQTVNGAGVRRASWPPTWNAISMPGSSGASIVNVPE